MLEKLRAISKFLNTLLLWIGGVALLVMMLVACVNMVTRAVWVPVKGSYEIIGFLGALVAAFALGSTQQHKGHIALTILAGMFSKRTERWIDVLSNGVCCLFFGLAGWRTALWAWSLVQTGELSDNLHIPYSPFPFAVALGLFALALALFCDTWAAAIEARNEGRKLRRRKTQTLGEGA